MRHLMRGISKPAAVLHAQPEYSLLKWPSGDCAISTSEGMLIMEVGESEEFFGAWDMCPSEQARLALITSYLEQHLFWAPVHWDNHKLIMGMGYPTNTHTRTLV